MCGYISNGVSVADLVPAVYFLEDGYLSSPRKEGDPLVAGSRACPNVQGAGVYRSCLAWGRVGTA